ncbi:MAG: NAD-dependent glyceraldehyde-3-phosphate dehydrogenase, partial [uncultured Solirubrobacteraceae bacterium]
DHPRRHQRLRPHRPQLLPRRAGLRRRHRDRRRERPDRQQEPGHAAALRLHPGPLPRRRDRRRGHHHRRREDLRRPRRARARQAAVGRPRRRRRRGVDRLLHRRRQGPRPHRGRREEGHHLGARQGRGPHRGDGREPRVVRRGRAPHHLQRLLHHQLPGPAREGARRHLRHREGPDDDDPRLHPGPEPPGRPAQGPAPRPRRRAEHRPDVDRCGQGDRPRAPAAEGQARRLRAARAGAHRLGHRPHRHPEPRDLRRRGQRRVQGRRRLRAALGLPHLHRGPDRLLRHRHRPELVHLRLRADQGDRRPGEGRRLVRQRVGLLQPPQGPDHLHQRL